MKPLFNPDEVKLTPMLYQYMRIKERYPGCLLLFRLGDFYELFFEDALEAAPALDIVLTKRGKKEGQDIPMCGIPFHASDSYIARLIQKGFKVALCEQLEDPKEAKKRGPQAIVTRDVVRILTPGTLTEDTLLNARHHNFLVCIAEHEKSIGLASVDISTGDFILEHFPLDELESALIRLNPKEIILSQMLLPVVEPWLKPWKAIISPQPSSRFDALNGKQKLLEMFHVATLEGFGTFSQAELMAGGAILDYVSLTQRGKLPPFSPPKCRKSSDHLEIDGATRESLEIHQTLRGEHHGSLLHAIDRTQTPLGSRLLSQRLANPLTNPASILLRQHAITWFLNHQEILESIRLALKGSPDLERILARIVLGRGGPRDLGNIKIALCVVEKIRAFFPAEKLTPSSELEEALRELSSYQSLIETLERTLGESLPPLAREGGFVAANIHPELEELRHLKDEGKHILTNLQSKYVTETGISSLKIKYNNILGYYIEITALHKDKTPETFIHRQSLVGAIRYTTIELSDLEQKLNTASERILALELEIFNSLVQMIIQEERALLKAARYLAIVDVASSLAFLARKEEYCAPSIDESSTLLIQKGRHPTVEPVLKSRLVPFTPNDCSLDTQNPFWLITGPNMAGKSTFLRQNALIILLAQMGSYVPAFKAHIGVVDRIFSRVGAADDLGRGQSTFMVEMVETATILNQATERSFVILDEIGRGTSTYDGLSIAWASAEHLYHVNKCRTLFATHYHELVGLKKNLPLLSCHTMHVKEWNQKIIFLHEVIEGQADQSYGIHVAELAGIPPSVIKRAQEILKSLEKGPSHTPPSLPLFDYTPPPQESIVEKKIKATDIDALSPRDALGFLYQLKEMLHDSTISD